jgi:hypothetical protein
MSPLLAIIGRGDQLSFDVAKALTDLILETMVEQSPHELELRTIHWPDGEARQVRAVPRAWLRRLERAADAGAFGRFEVPTIVHRILATDEPETAA